MPIVYLGVGSNLGDRFENIHQAKVRLKAVPDVRWKRESTLHETEPVGGPLQQGPYLNAVWEIETQLSAAELMDCLLEIEKGQGRIRSIPNAPRTIDLDMLAYGDSLIQTKGLMVPHPRMHERDFVLKPFAEINPLWVHPVRGKNVSQMREDLLASH